ncbi:hypothetical protein B484DRAFT_434793, partial [Ochromonadaceae sp. CCMP2298]
MNAEGVSLAAKALQHFNVLQGADASDASVASAVDISGQQLLRLAREGLQRARDRREPVDLEFLLVLLCDQGVEAEAEAEAGDAGASEGGEGGMRGTDSPASSDDIFSQLLSLAPLCAVSGQSLCRLFDALRLGAMGWGVSDSVSGSGGSGSGSGEDKRGLGQSGQVSPRTPTPWTPGSPRTPPIPTNQSRPGLQLPLHRHAQVLTALDLLVRQSDPPHVLLPGAKDSYLQVSNVPLSRCYTLCVWVKLSSVQNMKGFLLFRCRSQDSVVDAIVSTQEGRTELILRSSCEKNQQRDEVRCPLNISPDAWHLVTVKHVAQRGAPDSVVVWVDQRVETQADLFYPPSQGEALWVLGLGMTGKLGAVALYPEDLGAATVSLIHSLGPHTTSLLQGPRCPQSSFDTGHLILGTLTAKGALASRLCRLTPLFCVSAVHLPPPSQTQSQSPHQPTPLVTPGYLFPDHIDLQPRTYEHDEPLLCSLTGTAVVDLSSGGLDVWPEAGGVALLLYLFWIYCDVWGDSGRGGGGSGGSTGSGLAVDTSNTLISDTTPSTTTPTPTPPTHALSALRCLNTLLSQLLGASNDLKEQFVQLHGFHVLGSCLALLPAQVQVLMDTDLVDQLFDLVAAMGADATRGDGITAALQGLLFDFRVWGGLSVGVLCHYLQRLSGLLLESGALLYKSVGVQRLLDIFRLHVAGKIPSRVVAAAGDGVLGAEEGAAVECADCMHRLLIVCMEAAHAFAGKNKVSLAPEAEALLRCAEESHSSIVAERALRLVGHLRLTSPRSLAAALHSVRFTDTMIVPLLTRGGFSAEVRSSALCNLFWLLGGELRPIPPHVVELRKALHLLLVGGRGESARIRSLVAQINEVAHGAVEQGLWGEVGPSVLIGPHSQSSPSHSSAHSPSAHSPSAQSQCADSLQAQAETETGAETGAGWVLGAAAGSGSLSGTGSASQLSVGQVTSLVRVITHAGPYDAWMLLSILPGLLSRTSLECCQAVLMNVHVLFKTDESQSEALACLPTASWVKLFLALAAMGEMFLLRDGGEG